MPITALHLERTGLSQFSTSDVRNSIIKPVCDVSDYRHRLDINFLLINPLMISVPEQPVYLMVQLLRLLMSRCTTTANCYGNTVCAAQDLKYYNRR